jgi:hypothetical protein
MAKSIKKNDTETAIGAVVIAKYQLKNITLGEFKLSAQPNDDKAKGYQFDVQIKQQIVQKDKTVIANIILGIKDEKDTQLGSFSLFCVFEVENLRELINDKESLTAFGLEINKIAIGTARGAMFVLFRGTALHEAILPIADVDDLQSDKTS